MGVPEGIIARSMIVAFCYVLPYVIRVRVIYYIRNFDFACVKLKCHGMIFYVFGVIYILLQAFA